MYTRVAQIVLLLVAVASAVGADTFETLLTDGKPNPTENAPGVFLPIRDGSVDSGWVFMIQGGLPSELDQQAIDELWLFENGSWSQSSESAPRVSGHVLLAGADGRAYAFGGHDADDDGDLRKLNKVTAYQVRRQGGSLEVEVEEIDVPGDFPGKCTDAAAVAIDGGRSILHIGGFCNWEVLDNGSREVWEYRIDANRWTRRADLPQPRMKHSAVLYQGQVWVFAGDGPGGPSNDVLRYDPQADAWSAIQTAGGGPAPLEDHGSVVVGDSMLVFGGVRTDFWPETTSEVWEFDFTSLSWNRKEDLPHGLARMSIDAVPSELTAGSEAQVLIFGGAIDPWSFPIVLSDDTLVYTSDVKRSAQILAVPAIARVRGRGALFTSTLYFVNCGGSDLNLELTYTPRMDVGGSSITVQYTAASGVMEVIGDPLGTLFGISSNDSGVGSMLVEVVDGSAEELLMQTFVTAELDSGEEYGTYFPAIRNGQALSASEVGYLTSTEDPSSYRVNVGLMALADDTEVAVAPITRIGERMVSALNFDLDVGENLQINDIHKSFSIGSVSDVMLEVAVASGKAIAYATVVDGNGSYTGTSDPTTIQPIVAGSERVTLLEIGPVQGIDEFSGSATIVNLSDREADVRAEFYKRGVPGLSSSAWFTIDAGDAVGYRDFIREVLGIDDAVGTVVLESLNGARISATGREFANLRDEYSGEILGTAGTQLPGLTEAELLSGDRTWHVIGLRQSMTGDERERSHLAVFNPGSQSARVTVALFDGENGIFEGSRYWIVEGQELLHINNLLKKINASVDGKEKRIEITVDQAVYLQAYRVNTWGDSVTLMPQGG